MNYPISTKHIKGFMILVLICLTLVALMIAGYFALRSLQERLTAVPTIANIMPRTGPVGTTITITGSGFTPTKNSLHFGSGMAYINDLGSHEGQTLRLILPETFDVCDPNGENCVGFINIVSVGTYQISIINANGSSNTVTFSVTAQDARVPPFFSPTPAPGAKNIIKTVGEKEGSLLIQEINLDSVYGLWFEVYPIERPNDPGTPKTLYIGDDIGYACEGVSEKLIDINFSDQTITFNKVVGQPPLGGCPICLAGNTLIDTPSGLILVKDLQIGM